MGHREIDDLAGNLPRCVLVDVAHLFPKVYVILYTGLKFSALATFVMNDVEQLMPMMVHGTTPKKLGRDQFVIPKRTHHSQTIHP